MRWSKRSKRFVVILGGTLALTTGIARAGDETAAEEPRTHRARQILQHMDNQPSSPAESWRSHFQIQKKHGLEYRHALSMGQRDLVFAVHGPLVAKKTFGLGFSIRF